LVDSRERSRDKESLFVRLSRTRIGGRFCGAREVILLVVTENVGVSLKPRRLKLDSVAIEHGGTGRAKGRARNRGGFKMLIIKRKVSGALGMGQSYWAHHSKGEGEAPLLEGKGSAGSEWNRKGGTCHRQFVGLNQSIKESAQKKTTTTLIYSLDPRRRKRKEKRVTLGEVQALTWRNSAQV